jgi:hypothetical protein
LTYNPNEAAAGKYRADVPYGANQFRLGRTAKWLTRRAEVPRTREKAHLIGMNTVRAHPARRDRSGQCVRRFTVAAAPIFGTTNPTTFDTNAGGLRVVQECPVCPKCAYIYRLCTSPDAFGRAIYNTAL